MAFTLSLFDFIVLLGIVQGTISVVILQFYKAKQAGKTLLCLVLITLSLLSSKILLHTLGLWNTAYFRYFPLAIDTTIGPLLYLYACSLTSRSFKFDSKKILHFTPTIIFMLHAIIVYAMVLPQTNLELKNSIAQGLFYNRVKDIEEWIAIISAITYWVIATKQVKQYRIWLFNNESDSNYQELNWLKNILLCSGMMVAMFLIVFILDDLSDFGSHHFLHLQLFYVYLTLLIYYLSVKGLGLYNSTSSLYPVALSGTAQASVVIKEITNLKEFDTNLIKSAIIDALENKRLFLNPELSLKELAQSISYPVSAVSLTINQVFNVNFRNLVNSYRVEEVKNQLTKTGNTHLSLLGIALDCGFNSEASFYRIFRKHTGQSPNDYVKSLN